MAKTRSQTRNQAPQKQTTRKNGVAKRKPKYSKAKQNNTPVLKECVVRLQRIDLKKYLNESCEAKQSPARTVYKLRERKETQPPVKMLPKSLQQLVASSQAALYTSRAVRMWDKLKKEISGSNKNVLKVDDIVCARMTGHRPWPAKILSFKKNGTELHFFGTNNKGCVKKSDVILIDFCAEVIEEYLKVPKDDLCMKTLHYHMSFVKAAREISGLLRI